MVPIKYQNDPNFIRTYATSVWGGLGPTGDIRMNFIEDVFAFDDETQLTTTPEGEKSEDPIHSTGIIKVRKCEVVFRVDAIPGMINWLNKKMEEYIQLNPESAETLRAKKQQPTQE